MSDRAERSYLRPVTQTLGGVGG